MSSGEPQRHLELRPDQVPAQQLADGGALLDLLDRADRAGDALALGEHHPHARAARLRRCGADDRDVARGHRPGRDVAVGPTPAAPVSRRGGRAATRHRRPPAAWSWSPPRGLVGRRWRRRSRARVAARVAAPRGATGGAAGRSTTGASSVGGVVGDLRGGVTRRHRRTSSSSSGGGCPSVVRNGGRRRASAPTGVRHARSRAAGKPRGGEAGTPHGGSGSPAPSLPGGAPSRCTGSFGTIEVAGRDHGPAAAPPACSGVPGPLRFLRTGSGMPVGGSDGPPSGAPGRRFVASPRCRADDRDRPADRLGGLRRGPGGLHGVPRDVVLGQVARGGEARGWERDGRRRRERRCRLVPGRRARRHPGHAAPPARRPRRHGARGGRGWSGWPPSDAAISARTQCEPSSNSDG